MANAKLLVDTLLETEESKWLQKLKSSYTIEREGEALVLQVKSKDDFPFRVSRVDDNSGTYRLSKAFSPRTGVAPIYQFIGTFVSLDAALERIAKRHNKALTYMPHWEKV